nr:olfactory receptor 5M11-like [Dasypus novemcinctus]
MTNQSTVAQFILQGFSDIPTLNTLSIGVFMTIYIFGLFGNISIIMVTSKDGRLHSPMYFFLKNLSFLDICYTSVTMPKAIVNGILGSKDISFTECVAQLYLFFTLGATECFLFTAMAYDCSMAIYRPLLYCVIMSRNLCWKLVSTAWICGFLYSIFHAINTFSLPFCGSGVIDHFFCDNPPIMRLSCTDYSANEKMSFIYSSCILLGALVLILLSYTYIISTITKIHRVRGRWKAFSTCSSHLTTVLLFYGSAGSMYLKPTSNYSPIQGRLAAIFYSVITPTLNPIIYSLRNKEMKIALKNMYHREERIQ